MLKDSFEAINLPLYLVPYSVIPNRTGPDHAQGGILQVVANVKSRDQLGKDGAKTLKQHFLNQFGTESSSTYKQAQLEFARSSAGYAIVCYLLSIKVCLHFFSHSLTIMMKDRHNGNILIDNEGHLIHIDFGFLLGISPGGNLGFENAAFKLSKEMIDILGGGKTAEPFRCFVDLTVQGFLVAREIVMNILVSVTAMMDSGLPCFLHKDNNLDLLRDRFFVDCSNGEAARRMRSLIDDAASKWTTIAYDGIQKLQNNIYSDAWR
jgi:phosphatidylinositol 4-kinase A